MLALNDLELVVVGLAMAAAIFVAVNALLRARALARAGLLGGLGMRLARAESTELARALRAPSFLESGNDIWVLHLCEGEVDKTLTKVATIVEVLGGDLAARRGTAVAFPADPARPIPRQPDLRVLEVDGWRWVWRPWRTAATADEVLALVAAARGG